MTTKDKYEKISNAILSKLGTDVGTWKKCWSSLGQACNLDGKEYSGRNMLLSLLLAYEEFETPYFGTYKGLQKHNLQVKKGAKSFPVIYFSILEKEIENSDETKKIPLMKTYNVFNIDQCDGDKTKFTKKLEIVNTDSRVQEIDTWIEKQGIKITLGEPCYIPALHEIHMPKFEQFNSANEYYATIFHELTHATKHAMKRTQSKSKNDPVYAFEELIAESGSAILMAHFGLAPVLRDDHVQYIQSWIKGLKNDPKQFVDAFSHATKAVNYLLDDEENLKKIA